MIRYNKITNDKITKTVRNYNAKIKRLQRTNPYLALPDTITVKKVKGMVENRKDLNRTLNKLQRFTRKGAENTIILPSGELISAYELGEIKRESARLQRNLTRRINKLGTTQIKEEGKEIGFNYFQVGDMRLNNMIAKRNRLKNDLKKLLTTNELNISEYLAFMGKTRNKQNYQTEIFKNNYLDKMLFREAYMIGYDMDRINEIKEKMSKLTNQQFLNAFDSEKTIQMIRDMYPKSKNGNSAGDYFVFEEQLNEVYDSLYENIDKIVADYSKQGA